MPKYDATQPFASPAHIQFSHAEKTRFEFIREATDATLRLPLIAGFVAFVGAGLLVWAMGLSVRWAMAAAGLAVLGVGVYWTLDNKSIMPTTEVIEGVDPPQLPAPPQIPAQVTPWVLYDAQNNQRRGKFDVPSQLLTEWCEAAYYERSLAFRVWVSKFCEVFQGHGRERFETFRDQWTGGDPGKRLAKDAGGNVGLQLTPAGMDFCESWLISQGRLQVTEPTPLPAQLEAGQPKQRVGTQSHAHTEEE